MRIAPALGMIVVLSVSPALAAEPSPPPPPPSVGVADAPVTAKPSASLRLTPAGTVLTLTGSAMFYVAFALSVTAGLFLPLIGAISGQNFAPFLALVVPGVGPMLSWTWFTASGGVPQGAFVPLVVDAAAQLGGIALVLIARFELREPVPVSLAPLAVPGGGGARVAIAF